MTMTMMRRRTSFFLIAGLLLLLGKCADTAAGIAVEGKEATATATEKNKNKNVFFQKESLDLLSNFIRSNDKSSRSLFDLDLDSSSFIMMMMNDKEGEKENRNQQELQNFQQQQQRQRRSTLVTEENGGIPFTQCEDITEVYRSDWDRRYNGTNLLTTYYDCTCTEGILPADPTDYYQGELGTIVASCSLKEEKHCYKFLPYDIIWDHYLNAASSGAKVGVDPDTHPDSIEQCVQHSMEITVWVNNTSTSSTLTTPIIAPVAKRNKSCIDFLLGGPKKLSVNHEDDETPIVAPGTYCSSNSPMCVNIMRQDLESTKAFTTLICNDRTKCLDFFQQDLGYTNDQAVAMCPLTQLNEEECAVSFNSYASSNTSCAVWEAEDDTFNSDTADNYYFLVTLADCTNVLPCAKPSCGIVPRTDANLNTLFWTFPECTNHTITLLESEGDGNDGNDDDISVGFRLVTIIGKTFCGFMTILFLF